MDTPQQQTPMENSESRNCRSTQFNNLSNTLNSGHTTTQYNGQFSQSQLYTNNT